MNNSGENIKIYPLYFFQVLSLALLSEATTLPFSIGHYSVFCAAFVIVFEN